MKRLLVAGVFLLPFVDCASAQKITRDDEVKLLDPRGNSVMEENALRCGAYFAVRTDVVPDDTLVIVFLTEVPARFKRTPEDKVMTAFAKPDQLYVLIDPEKIPPTLELQEVNGTRFRLVLRMTQAEFEKSPCLPKPQEQ